MANPNEFQFDINPEIEDGVYSNLALFTHSGTEFIMDFLRILPNRQRPKVVSRVVLSPEHAKRVFMALRENIAKYEQNFGPINIHEEAPRTIAPFKSPKGEA